MDSPILGMMSIPRVVEVKNGKIYFRVHPFLCRTERKLMLEDIVSSVRVKKSAQTEVRCIRHFPSFVQSLQHRN